MSEKLTIDDKFKYIITANINTFLDMLNNNPQDLLNYVKEFKETFNNNWELLQKLGDTIRPKDTITHTTYIISLFDFMNTIIFDSNFNLKANDDILKEIQDNIMSIRDINKKMLALEKKRLEKEIKRGA